MSEGIRNHLRSNIIGYIALFAVAISGTATALPGKNKVDHNDLQKHVVHTGKIHTGAVKAPKIAKGAVKAGKLADGSVGAPKLAAIIQVEEPTEHVGLLAVTASCPAGTRVIGGGFETDATDPGDPLITDSFRVDNGWRVTFDMGTETQSATAFAYCLAG